MLRTRMLAALIAAFASVAGPFAQSPKPAEPIGVLIGLRANVGNPLSVNEAPQPSALRTMWVHGTTGAKPGAPLELRELVVPRRSGFWKLGLVADCVEENYVDADGAARGSMTTLNASLWADRIDKLPALKPKRCSRQDVTCSVVFETWIRWVWPEYVSVNDGGESGCGAHPGGTIAHRVRGLSDFKDLNIRDVLGLAVEQSFRRAFEAAREEDAKDRTLDEVKGCHEGVTFDPGAWNIEREAGKWRIKGWTDTQRWCGVGFDYFVDADLSRITGKRPDEAARWPALKARWPEIADVHTSPGGQWTIIASGGELLIFIGASLDGEPLRIKKGHFEEVVMVEWATGSNVARWNDQIARLRR